MNYVDWTKSVPEAITGDPLWQVEAYRLALFLSDLGWHDTAKLIQDRRMFGLSDQLYRAVGSIGANISEGYSRAGGRDRARFYEYALGSVRESRGWYYKGRHVLGEDVSRHRMNLLTQIIRLLLKMIPDQRNTSLHEESIPYVCSPAPLDVASPDLGELLTKVPLPALTDHASLLTSPDE